MEALKALIVEDDLIRFIFFIEYTIYLASLSEVIGAKAVGSTFVRLYKVNSEKENPKNEIKTIPSQNITFIFKFFSIIT